MNDPRRFRFVDGHELTTIEQVIFATMPDRPRVMTIGDLVRLHPEYAKSSARSAVNRLRRAGLLELINETYGIVRKVKGATLPIDLRGHGPRATPRTKQFGAPVRRWVIT